MVVAGEVKGEVSQELPGCGVDDPDVEVLYEQDDGGSGMGSADPDVEEVAGDAQGDRVRCVERAPRVGLEGVLALEPVAGDEAADPALGDPVGTGYLAL